MCVYVFESYVYTIYIFGLMLLYLLPFFRFHPCFSAVAAAALNPESVYHEIEPRDLSCEYMNKAMFSGAFT